MAASHVVAGAGVEDGDGKEADSGRDEDGVEHVPLPLGASEARADQLLGVNNGGLDI
jgi:hypothetical protein